MFFSESLLHLKGRSMHMAIYTFIYKICPLDRKIAFITEMAWINSNSYEERGKAARTQYDKLEKYIKVQQPLLGKKNSQGCNLRCPFIFKVFYL